MGKKFFDIPTSANAFICRLDEFFCDNLRTAGKRSLAHLKDKHIVEPVEFSMPTHGSSIESMLDRGEAWLSESGGLVLSTDPKFSNYGRPLKVKIIPTPTGITVYLDLIGAGKLIRPDLYELFVSFLEGMTVPDEPASSQPAPAELASSQAALAGPASNPIGDDYPFVKKMLSSLPRQEDFLGKWHKQPDDQREDLNEMLKMLKEGGYKLEAIARKFGYSDHSGISNKLYRLFGMRSEEIVEVLTS